MRYTSISSFVLALLLGISSYLAFEGTARADDPEDTEESDTEQDDSEGEKTHRFSYRTGQGGEIERENREKGVGKVETDTAQHGLRNVMERKRLIHDQHEIGRGLNTDAYIDDS